MSGVPGTATATDMVGMPGPLYAGSASDEGKR